MFLRKKQKQAGFTLVELLVTISIFVVLTGVVLFSQSKFNSSILLTNLAYDAGLTIRLAQNYGINIKQFNSSGASSRFLPYGVHFDINSVENSKSFILFADTSYVGENDLGDGLYDYPSGANLLSCTDSNEVDRGCVSKYNILRGNYISKIEVTAGGSTSTANALDIVFRRPNPDAYIRANNLTDLKTDATIFFSGADGSIRKVKVSSNGLIEILH